MFPFTWLWEMRMVVEFHGGPKDGDREVTDGLDSWPIVAVHPVVLSPWGHDQDQEPLYRVVRTGTYHREGRVMRWERA